MIFEMPSLIKRRTSIITTREALSDYMILYHSVTRGRTLVDRLKKIHGQVSIMGKDMMFFELLPIGQCIVTSPDVEKVLRLTKLTLNKINDL